MPVDLYVGGAEHAVLHLLYARFWHKVLYDIGVVSTKEPFSKLVNQGMILGEMEYTIWKDPETNSWIDYDKIGSTGQSKVWSGEKIDENEVEKRGEHFYKKGTEIKVQAKAHKMSKSRGNVINPDSVIEQYGADSLRLYEMFMGPLEQVKPWSTKGVEGVNRFLNRAWRLILDEETGELRNELSEASPTKEQLKSLHEAIKKVTEDIEELRFNTAISALMIFVNEANQWKEIPHSVAKEFVLILSPFSPHIAEELWAKLGNKQTLAYEDWPLYNEEYLKADSVLYPVQVNGKVRANLEIPVDKAIDKEYVLKKAKEDPKVQNYLINSVIVKEVFVPQRIINIVVRPA